MLLCGVVSNVWSQPFYLFLSNGFRYSPDTAWAWTLWCHSVTCFLDGHVLLTGETFHLACQLRFVFIFTKHLFCCNTLLVYKQESDGLDGAVILFSSVWNQGPLKCFKNAFKKQWMKNVRASYWIMLLYGVCKTSKIWSQPFWLFLNNSFQDLPVTW